MSSEDTKILEFNRYQKPDSTIHYLCRSWILEKIDGGEKSPKNSSTTKVCKHIPSGFPTSHVL